MLERRDEFCEACWCIFREISTLFHFEGLAMVDTAKTACAHDDHETNSEAVERLLIKCLDMSKMCKRNVMPLPLQSTMLIITTRPEPPSFSNVSRNFNDETSTTSPH